MNQNQKVTFAVDSKPPNYGPMKIHTKSIKCKERVNVVTDNEANVLIEKDIRLVMFQSGVTREIAITALRKHDGDIVNAIMDL